MKNVLQCTVCVYIKKTFYKSCGGNQEWEKEVCLCERASEKERNEKKIKERKYNWNTKNIHTYRCVCVVCVDKMLLSRWKYAYGKVQGTNLPHKFNTLIGNMAMWKFAHRNYFYECFGRAGACVGTRVYASYYKMCAQNRFQSRKFMCHHNVESYA